MLDLSKRQRERKKQKKEQMGQIEHNSQDGILPLKTVTITLNAKCLNVKIKRQRFSNWIKKQYPTIKLSIRNPTQGSVSSLSVVSSWSVLPRGYRAMQVGVWAHHPRVLPSFPTPGPHIGRQDTQMSPQQEAQWGLERKGRATCPSPMHSMHRHPRACECQCPPGTPRDWQDRYTGTLTPWAVCPPQTTSRAQWPAWHSACPARALPSTSMATPTPETAGCAC